MTPCDLYEYSYQEARTSTVLIVTLGKSETYKETIKEKSTILPYSIHKRIHVRPQKKKSIQGIHVNVNTIQSTVLYSYGCRAYMYCTRTGTRTVKVWYTGTVLTTVR